MAGIALFWPLRGMLAGLVVPLMLVNLVGPGIDVTGRMTFLALEPELCTRLTTIYIVLMFVGGGIGSIAGTASFDVFGWGGTCALLAGFSALLTLLFIAAWRWK